VADANILQASVSQPNAVQKEVAQATMELVQARTVKLGAIPGAGKNKTASARFNLVFDGSPRPERAEFVEGDESLRSAGEQLREKDYLVRFPDASSIKIVRRGQLSCGSSGCAVELLPIEAETAAVATTPAVEPAVAVVPSSRGGHTRVCRGDETDTSTCASPPHATYSPDPSYPESERRAGHEGTVVLHLVVGADGEPHDVTVSRSLSPEFDAAAVEAVKTWKFSPASKSGKPISVDVNVEVAFRLSHRR